MNSVTIVGFVGADPEQRQARNNNGSKFNSSLRRHAAVVEEHRRRVGVEDRVASRLRVPSAAPEYVSTTIKKGSHVLVEGTLVSTTYERGNGKGKKAKSNKQTFWCIRADVVRKLDRGEPEPETTASGVAASPEALGASDPAPF